MKKTSILTTLPAFALALTLGACGGDGNDDPIPSSPLTECFTVTGGVSFKMIVSPPPPSDNSSETGSLSESVTKLGKYDGNNVMEQSFIYKTGDPGKTVTVKRIKTIVWTIKKNGDINFIAEMNTNPDNTRRSPDRPINITLPHDMNADTPPVGGIAFVGVEKEMSLASPPTTFSNVCHLKIQPQINGITDLWYAPRYGLIKANNLDDPSVPEVRYDGRL